MQTIKKNQNEHKYNRMFEKVKLKQKCFKPGFVFVFVPDDQQGATLLVAKKTPIDEVYKNRIF